ncbi:replication protein, partial [Klebsiella pneumoniae]|nr:replication protein [Klebsiella pneumoniae]
LLTKWTKHMANGFSIPPIRRQLAAPRHPAGPTPAQILMEEYKRRKAAGLTK